MRAIRERLRGVFTTRRYTNPCLPLALPLPLQFVYCSAFADVTVVYETPLRVFAALPRNTSVEFCDYLFPDETLADSANRFHDLVGIEAGDIDASAEHVPSESRILLSLWFDGFVLQLK